jgi:hypothetical protein
VQFDVVDGSPTNCACFIEMPTSCCEYVGNVSREQQLRRALERFLRPALHAKTLGFTHPKTSEAVDFDSDLPQDFVSLLSDLQQLPPLD